MSGLISRDQHSLLGCTTPSSTTTGNSSQQQHQQFLSSPAQQRPGSPLPLTIFFPSRVVSNLHDITNKSMRQRGLHVKEVASKLNSMTQEMFSCGTPRQRDGGLERHHNSSNKIFRHWEGRNQDRKRQLECLLDESDSCNNGDDDYDDYGMEDGEGIEVNAEGSLRPAYELYRV